MDIIFEMILEIFLEGSLEICSNKKLSKWIRYPLLMILTLIFIAIVLGLLMLGIYLFKTSIIISLIFIVCSFLLCIGTIIKLKNLYNERK